MATHSSILAWRIPWTEETGGLQFMRVTKSWTQQNDSNLYIHPPLLDLPHTTPTSHPSRSSQSTELSSLCCTAGSHSLSVSHTAVYMYQCHSPNAPNPLLPPLSTCPFSMSTSLFLPYKEVHVKEMGRPPDHLTCLSRNLYAGQQATVRTGHGTTDWFQISKPGTKVLPGAH